MDEAVKVLRKKCNDLEDEVDAQTEAAEAAKEAQAAAEKCGLEVSWGKDHLGKELYMKTKFYVSAFEYAPNLDRNIIYSSIADHHMWFDSWPGV